MKDYATLWFNDLERRLGNEFVFDRMANENIRIFKEKGIKAGKLELNAKDLGNVVFHDSCYPGRYNGIYEAQRNIIASVTGRMPTEMEHRYEKSFCCGAGGGRMWMEESTGKRINAG